MTSTRTAVPMIRPGGSRLARQATANLSTQRCKAPLPRPLAPYAPETRIDIVALRKVERHRTGVSGHDLSAVRRDDSDDCRGEHFLRGPRIQDPRQQNERGTVSKRMRYRAVEFAGRHSSLV